MNKFKIIILVCVIILLVLGVDNCKAQTFSKDLLTLKVGDEHIVIRARLDRTTKMHFARDFALSNLLSFAGLKKPTNRIVMYTFIIAFELGQGELDLIDILVGVIGVELNFCLRR